MADSNALNFWGGLILGVGITAASGYWFIVQKDSNKKASAPTEQSEKEKKAKEDINFQFYGLLPELEVVLPDDLQQKPIREQLLKSEESDKNTTQSQPSSNTQTVNTPKATREQIESLPGSYYLQTGSFSNADDADRMKASLSLLGFEVSVQEVTVNNQRYQRVRVGPFSEYDNLQSAKDQLASNNYKFIAIKQK